MEINIKVTNKKCFVNNLYVTETKQKILNIQKLKSKNERCVCDK